MNTLLVPVDFSLASKKAAEYAFFMAKDQSFKIIFIHAYSAEYIPFTGNERENMVQPATINKIFKKEFIEQDLFDFFNSLGDLSLIEYENYVGMGPIVEIICKTAKEKEADLIIMGTRNTISAKNFFLGTYSERVCRKAGCPVLVVPKNLKDFKLDTIGLAMDTNNIGHTIRLDSLVQLIKLFDSKLRIVHVSDEEKIAFNDAAILENYKKALEAINYSFHVYFEIRAEENLREFLNRFPVDLLVIIYRDQKFFERFFQPGIREKMIFKADIPLLVLK